jgi:predicted 3-demethylubiquinone-9 3-methyltransferase (glyoxalase superfamily)
MHSISPFLWFDTHAREAAEFYVSIFPNSSIDSVVPYPDGSSSGAVRIMSVSFTLDGMQFDAMNAGPEFPFTEAISFFVHADTQDRIDYYWDALLANGGEESQCGWLKDQFGLSWQVVPARLGELLSDQDPGRSSRAMRAMMGMRKIVIADLEAAADAA